MVWCEPLPLLPSSIPTQLTSSEPRLFVPCRDLCALIPRDLFLSVPDHLFTPILTHLIAQVPRDPLILMSFSRLQLGCFPQTAAEQHNGAAWTWCMEESSH